MMPHSAILSREEKLVLKDALILYVENLQRKYYGEHLIGTPSYLKHMKEVSNIVEKLHLSELYK